MCGISGIVSKSKRQITHSEIKSITDVIEHRGPDGEGFFCENNIGLGHRRLAIIDTSSEGNQPMFYDNKYVIVFNGEIYNYIEVREELIKLGYIFKTKSDTEVLLTAYDQWGTNCVTKFNGMWAFCIYDKQKNELFCSRDRFGVKPFYYINNTEYFIFSSEIKQLLPYTERKVNHKVLGEFLILKKDENIEETFFEGIKKLPGSHNLVFSLSKNSCKINKYYEIEFRKEVSDLNLEDAVKTLSKGLKESIKLRLRSDVVVGSCLSGGLDSSAIVAIAAQEFDLDKNFKGIHAKSTESFTDESKYARLIADHAGINFIETEPSNDYFLDTIEKLIGVQEEPFTGPSLVMQYAVFEKAKREGCIVMLDGQGGDETLLGYERYFPATLNGSNFIQKIGEMYAYSSKSRLSFIEMLKYYYYFKTPTLRKRKLIHQSNYVNASLLDVIDTNVLYEFSEAYKNPFELQKLELFKTQLPHLLRYEDKNSMAHSIESRLPFLDYKLVEKSISLNAKFKIKDGWSKYVLREAVNQYMPAEVTWRRFKRGFESPRPWLNYKDHFLKEIKKSKLLNHFTNGNFDEINSSILFKLYVISVWERIYDVKL